MTKRHYVYLVYNNKYFYIGKRSLPKKFDNISQDWKYLGSSISKKKAAVAFRKSIRCKVILRVFDTPKEALGYEIKLHKFFDVVRNPRFVNFGIQTSKGWDCTGTRQEMTPARLKKHQEHSQLMSTEFNPMSKLENRIKISLALASQSEERSQRLKENNPMDNPVHRQTLSNSLRKNKEVYVWKNGTICDIYNHPKYGNSLRRLVNNECTPGGRLQTVGNRRDGWVIAACPLTCRLK